MAADVTGVWLLLRYEPVEENIARLLQGFLVGAGVVAVVAWTAPVMEDLRLGDDELLHPNLIGFEFAIAVLLASYLAQRNRWWRWVAVAFGITTVRTLSKGAIISFLFASLYYVLRGLKLHGKTRLYVSLASSITLACFWSLFEAYLDLYTQGNSIETLTGRTYIWSKSFEIAIEKPWLGHGFDSFRWIFPPFQNFQPWQAHNEAIQQLFTYGVVGLALVIGIYITFYRRIRVSSNGALKPVATAILILVLVRGLVDTDRFETCFPLWLMVLLSVGLARKSVTLAETLT
jgi:O-antigen ligase